jgi:RNA polymerase sigma factor for flagellar operon FliA
MSDAERLQTALSLHCVEELTLREIGAVLEVTEERVSQLHKEAVSSLRALLGPDAG